jgi:iron complex transport system ATP-binding protein
MSILEVRDLSAGYGNGGVIRDVSFSIGEGEFVAILGRNGSGKSTLIKALQKLVPFVSGIIRDGEEDLLAMGRRRMARRVAYVPQLHDPVFEFSTEEVILMGRYIHQGRFSRVSIEDARILEEVLRLTGTASLRRKKMSRLSGGEQQRVAIARALAQDTPYLFLDEPSSHLDISYQVEIYDILSRLRNEQGKTILVAEHNINLAAAYSDRLICLKDGEIKTEGKPEALISRENIKNIFDAEVDIRLNAGTGLPEISLVTAGRRP